MTWYCEIRDHGRRWVVTCDEYVKLAEDAISDKAMVRLFSVEADDWSTEEVPRV